MTTCDRCAATAVASIGIEHLCAGHHAEALDPIRARVMTREAFDGTGRQTGPIRPDWGPGWADLTCTSCDATWTGPIGEHCPYCIRQYQRLLADQTALVLTPPDVDPEAADRRTALGAWLDRMMVARDAGIITTDDARRAWERGTRLDHGRAA